MLEDEHLEKRTDASTALNLNDQEEREATDKPTTIPVPVLTKSPTRRSLSKDKKVPVPVTSIFIINVGASGQFCPDTHTKTLKKKPGSDPKLSTSFGFGKYCSLNIQYRYCSDKRNKQKDILIL
jgi:hypothetical protein